MNWKPIDDDAKRLHDAILGGPGWVKVGWWCARCGAFHPRGDLSETLEPTHYQEFPDPPAGERERRYPKPKPLDADRLEHVLMAVGISTSNTAERELRRHIAYLEAAEAGLQTMVEQAEDRANALAAELTAVKTAYAAAAQAREEERGRVADALDALQIIKHIAIDCGSELSAQAHGRPPSSKEALVGLSRSCRNVYEGAFPLIDRIKAALAPTETPNVD